MIILCWFISLRAPFPRWPQWSKHTSISENTPALQSYVSWRVVSSEMLLCFLKSWVLWNGVVPWGPPYLLHYISTWSIVDVKRKWSCTHCSRYASQFISCYLMFWTPWTFLESGFVRKRWQHWWNSQQKRENYVFLLCKLLKNLYEDTVMLRKGSVRNNHFWNWCKTFQQDSISAGWWKTIFFVIYCK